jgi:nitroreductase
MELYDAIRQRRTIKTFTHQPIAEDLLERVLETAIWAQNHRLTQPWRLRWIGPETREELAKAHENSRHKIMNPTELVVISNVISEDEAVRREDYAATACAIQNIALAAHSEGIGSIWSTGKHTNDPKTYPVLGIDPAKEEIVAFLAFGYPEMTPEAPKRKPLSEVLEHLP